MAKEKDYEKRIKLIGKRIRELRKEAGFTSHETFAFEHDIPRMQYWRLEDGANMQLTSLLRILDCHKLTLKEFFDRIEE